MDSATNFLILFLFHAACNLVAGKNILLKSILILRHGDRSPLVEPYHNDPYKENDWPQEKWQLLTPAGIEKVYNTGRAFLERYTKEHNLIDLGKVKDEVYITSTKVQRAIDSAQAFAHGFADKEANLPSEEKQNVLFKTSLIDVDDQPYTKRGLYNGSLMRTHKHDSTKDGEYFSCPLYDMLAIPAIHSYKEKIEKKLDPVVKHAVNYTGFYLFKEFKDLEGVAYEHWIYIRTPVSKFSYPDEFGRNKSFQINVCRRLDRTSTKLGKKNIHKPSPGYNNMEFYKIMLEISYDYQSDMDSGRMGKLHTGRLLGDWMTHIDPLLEHERNVTPKVQPVVTGPKLVVYSAHSETQIGLMNLMDVTRKLGCPTAGAFALEIYWNPKSKMIIAEMHQFADGVFKQLDISSKKPKEGVQLKDFVEEKKFQDKAIHTDDQWKEECKMTTLDSICNFVSTNLRRGCSDYLGITPPRPKSSVNDPKKVFDELTLSIQPKANSEGEKLRREGHINH
ncbi:histidine phosphatase superfamily (branch 2) domain-containing protein [Ditylenchus destructor]|uniref:2-phosphoxylose phosphatase 1 n=1 Tax=Ditylenchus destructor TaxID=166010 RepID=A0AAD4MQR9_9BILA|nr:histidine phosphatase superfamily (branch 2) domain-containing protein [Ditylenchus destructor]